MKQSCHISVMRENILQGFKDCNLLSFCDGTLGAGGHAQALLQAHPEIKTFYAFDRDPLAHTIAGEVLQPFKEKVVHIHQNFAHLRDEFKEQDVKKVDGFMFDLGVSSMQLDQGERGFSFRVDAPLDMRMDPTRGKSASQVLSELSEKDLGEILRDYGEVPFWRRAASEIVQARRSSPIETTLQLSEIITNMLGGRGKLHPATLVFQALRIFVNRELESLEEGLLAALDHLSPGGKIGVISFHSLEDRIVKNIFRDAASPIRDERGKKVADSPFSLVVKKPEIPSQKEIKANPRARSAKLRWIQHRA